MTHHRIFIGFEEVAGIYAGLRQGLEELGCLVSLIEKVPHRFGYASRCNQNEIEKCIWQLTCADSATRESSAQALEIAIKEHDFFLFTAATAFPHLELREVLERIKQAGKRTIFLFTGSESRPVFLSRIGYETRDGQIPELQSLLNRHRHMVNSLSIIEELADAIICNPLTAQLARRSFVNFFEFGNPTWASIDCADLERESGQKGPWRICHAPSWPGLKGTNEILAAIKLLRNEGFDIELSLLTDVSHQEVLLALRKCDLVIDQLYSDIPLASLGCEAAALGIPVAIGGYGWEEMRRVCRSERVPPAFTIDSDKLVDDLRVILSGGKAAAHAMGLSSRQFLRENWTPCQVAQRLLNLFQSQKIPPEWIVLPEDCHYAWGVGISKRQALETVGSFTKVFGWESLEINGENTVFPTLQEALKVAYDDHSLRRQIALRSSKERQATEQIELSKKRQRIINLKNQLAKTKLECEQRREELTALRARGWWRRLRNQ